MILVFFIYGLSFFSLGLAILVYPRNGSAFRLANKLWLLGAFGLTHGAHEWIDLYHDYLSVQPTRSLEVFGLVLQAVSYLFLIRFGTRTLAMPNSAFNRIRHVQTILPVLAATAVLLARSKFLAADIWARYLLGMPAGLLASYALLQHSEEIGPLPGPAIKPYLKTAAAAFFCYAFLTGLVVPDAAFFPASIINYSLFGQVIGIPVQVFKTACAVIIAFSMIRVLTVFDWEAKNALRESRDELQKAYHDVERKVQKRTSQLMLAGSRLQEEIIEHRRSENELKLFQYLINNSNDSIFIVDAETARVLKANESACRDLQYSRGEFSALHVFDYALNVLDFDSWQRHARRIKEQGHHYFETVHRRKDGSVIPVEISARFIHHDRKNYIVSIARDISERRRAQTALEKWADIFTCTKIGVVILGPTGKTLDMMNPAFASMHGYAIEELSGRPVEEIIPSDQAEAFRSRIDRIQRQRHAVFDAVHQRKDGTTFPVQIDATILKDNNEVLYYIVNVVDISDRKQVEQVLRYSSHQWRATFDAIRDMIFLLDHDGRIKRCNRAAAEYFEMTIEAVIGRLCRDLMRAFHFAETVCPFERMQISKRREHARVQQGDRTFDVMVDPMLDQSGEVIGAVHIMYDVTDGKKVEEELIKTQKLESIGILAGGIAHDFNNILTGIMGNVSLALADKNVNGTVYARLVEAEKACTKAKDLTQRLLTFSSGGAPVKRVCVLTDIVREAVVLALAGSAVKSEFHIPEKGWLVDIDEGQMRQVIHNITVNAAEAMPRGGTVSAVCEQVAADDAGSPLTGCTTVRITIRDEGTGISTAHLGKIFDPFFSTKQKRSGLGLATSYSIIKNHGGAITVESEPDRGAAFHIYLPVFEERHPVKNQPAAGASGRVLIMDDEKIVRDVASAMLKQIGYEVDLAEDGVEAVSMYWEAKKNDCPFHAVILDLTVPGGMGGRETIAKLREIDPGVKAIVSSGYAKDPIMANYREHGFSGVVAKPYRLDELEHAVKALLQPSLQ